MKGITVLARIIDPDYWEETGPLIYKEDSEDYIYNTYHSLGASLSTTMPCEENQWKTMTIQFRKDY